MLNSGERQVATRRDGVRADHTARYDWAAQQLPAGSYVIDLGCGIGYGARILADAGHSVFAVDIDAETIQFARRHFAHERIEYVHAAAGGVFLPHADAVVMFEIIEHLKDPEPVLKLAREAAPLLLASVPNEDAFPWRPEYAFHHRHYTIEPVPRPAGPLRLPQRVGRRPARRGIAGGGQAQPAAAHPGGAGQAGRSQLRHRGRLPHP
jgi:SAM-dependent methyltransferase